LRTLTLRFWDENENKLVGYAGLRRIRAQLRR